MTINRDVVVVLGMHRSGTSAITRGLNVLGYDLGKTLMAPSEVDNPTGFWENHHIYEAQENFLEQIGARWDGVRLIRADELVPLRERFRDVMAPVLQREFGESRRWAFKDPRTALLLPLWRDLLEQPDATVRYLIIVRNPLSVAASLESRNGFDRKKAFLLWLEHTAAALIGTRDARRMVLDYDLFMDDAAEGLASIATFLDSQAADVSDPEVQEYLSGFLRSSLRHSRFSVEDLKRDPETLPSARRLYRAVRRCAQGSASLDGKSLDGMLRNVSRQLEDWSPLLDQIDDLQQHLGCQEQRDARLQSKEAELTRADARIETLSSELAATVEAADEVRRRTLEVESQKEHAEEECRALQNQLSAMRGKLDRATDDLVTASEKIQHLEELDTELGAQNLALSGEAKSLRKELQDAGATLDSMRSRVTDLERERSINETEIGRLRDTVRGLQVTVDAIRSSDSWRLTAPLRAASRAMRGHRIGRVRFLASVSGRARQLISLMPIGPRQKLKNVLYRTAPMLFRGSASYALWREMLGRRTAVQVVRTSTEPVRVPCHHSPRASVIVPAYNKFDLTQSCIRSVVENAGIDDYEVILADDASTDETRFAERYLPGVRHVRQQANLGFLGNCNAAAKEARGRYIVFLNNDTQVQDGWLRHLVDLAERRRDAGVIGSKLLFPNGTLQEAGGIVWNDGSAWNFGRADDADRPDYNYVKPVDYVSGASMLVDASLWRELQGFDTRFTPAYCEDMDFCFQVRAQGRTVLYQPESAVVHIEGASHGRSESSGIKRYQVENQRRALEKWYDVLTREHFPNGAAVFLARDRSSGCRRVLVVDHYVPHVDQDAGSRTTYSFVTTLIDMGYKVHFIGDNFYRHEPYTTMLQQLGVEVLYGPHYARNWQQWWRECGGYFDLALLNRPHIACKYLEPLKSAHPDVRLVYYGHDLHALRDVREQGKRFESPYDIRASEWFLVERRLFESCDITLTCSAVEQKIISEIAPEASVQLIPAYIFEQTNRRAYHPAQRSGFLFVGGFRHAPNVDGIVWFVRDVLEALAVPEGFHQEVLIVGSEPTAEVMALNSDQVRVIGFVGDDELEDLYNRCRGAIVPLRFGAGVKGKLVEALSWGVPVLTTSIGAEGLPDIEDAVEIADDPRDFARALMTLARDDERCTELSNAGLGYAQVRFSATAASVAMEAALIQRQDLGTGEQVGSVSARVRAASNQ